MTTSQVLLVHICAAVIGVIAGLLAMVFRKGSGLHRVAGNAFFISMFIATALGAIVAIFLRPNSGNTIGSTLSFYLVITGWVTIKRTDGKIGLFDFAALLMVLTIVFAAWRWGFQAASSAKGIKDKYPAPFFFVFGSFALMFAAADVRMLIRGGVSGTKRIARHLWRMSFALLFALMSAYPGQTRFFPPEWKSRMLFTPHILVFVIAIYWLVRLRRSRGKTQPLPPSPQVVRA